MLNQLPFSRRNYLLMIVGIVLILIGYIVMTMDSELYGFGFLGLTLGPAIAMIGFIVEFFAIMLPKEGDDTTSTSKRA